MMTFLDGCTLLRKKLASLAGRSGNPDLDKQQNKCINEHLHINVCLNLRPKGLFKPSG